MDKTDPKWKLNDNRTGKRWYGRNVFIINGYKPVESAPELLDEIRSRIKCRN